MADHIKLVLISALTMLLAVVFVPSTAYSQTIEPSGIGLEELVVCSAENGLQTPEQGLSGQNLRRSHAIGWMSPSGEVVRDEISPENPFSAAPNADVRWRWEVPSLGLSGFCGPASAGYPDANCIKVVQNDGSVIHMVQWTRIDRPTLLTFFREGEEDVDILVDPGNGEAQTPTSDEWRWFIYLDPPKWGTCGPGPMAHGHHWVLLPMVSAR